MQSEKSTLCTCIYVLQKSVSYVSSEYHVQLSDRNAFIFLSVLPSQYSCRWASCVLFYLIHQQQNFQMNSHSRVFPLRVDTLNRTKKSLILKSWLLIWKLCKSEKIIPGLGKLNELCLQLKNQKGLYREEQTLYLIQFCVQREYMKLHTEDDFSLSWLN